MADRLEIETLQALADFRGFLARFREHCEALMDRAVWEIDDKGACAEQTATSLAARVEDARQALDIARARRNDEAASFYQEEQLRALAEALTRREERAAEIETARRGIAAQEERCRTELSRARTSLGEDCERGIAYLDRIGGLLEEYTQIIEGPAPAPSRQLSWDDDCSELWRSFHGPLFVGEPAPEQVHQSDLGDCYFLGPIVGLAHQHPDLVRKAIRRNRDGTFTVRMFEEQPDGSFEPVFVTVDNRLPVDADNTQVKYARTNPTNSNGLWVSILEKAYAQFHGGYEHIGNGGRSEDGLAALTGAAAITLQVTSPRIWSELRARLVDGAIVCAMKHDDRGPVPGHHVYAILGVREADGRRTVTLRNPWGNPEHPSGYGDRFTIDLDDFCRAFDEVACSTPRKETGQ